MSVKTPTVVGVKTPPAVTPVPVHVPPVGVYPVSVVAIGWLQTDIGFPASRTGRGLTVITTEPVVEQPVAVIVCVKKYVVVTFGETVGFANAEIKPNGMLVQE